jgi:hypothetical protein
MGDWSDSWRGFNEGMSLAVQARHLRNQEKLDRERLGLEDRRATEEAKTADLSRQLMSRRLARPVVDKAPEGMVPTKLRVDEYGNPQYDYEPLPDLQVLDLGGRKMAVNRSNPSQAPIVIPLTAAEQMERLGGGGAPAGPSAPTAPSAPQVRPPLRLPPPGAGTSTHGASAAGSHTLPDIGASPTFRMKGISFGPDGSAQISSAPYYGEREPSVVDMQDDAGKPVLDTTGHPRQATRTWDSEKGVWQYQPLAPDSERGKVPERQALLQNLISGKRYLQQLYNTIEQNGTGSQPWKDPKHRATMQQNAYQAALAIEKGNDPGGVAMPAKVEATMEHLFPWVHGAGPGGLLPGGLFTRDTTALANLRKAMADLDAKVDAYGLRPDHDKEMRNMAENYPAFQSPEQADAWAREHGLPDGSPIKVGNVWGTYRR